MDGWTSPVTAALVSDTVGSERNQEAVNVAVKVSTSHGVERTFEEEKTWHCQKTLESGKTELSS